LAPSSTFYTGPGTCLSFDTASSGIDIDLRLIFFFFVCCPSRYCSYKMAFQALSPLHRSRIRVPQHKQNRAIHCKSVVVACWKCQHRPAVFGKPPQRLVSLSKLQLMRVKQQPGEPEIAKNEKRSERPGGGGTEDTEQVQTVAVK